VPPAIPAVRRIKRALALEDGQAMTVRPSDWGAENIGRAPVRVEVLGRPQGPVVRTIDA
jgi:hypothetical protein